MSTTDGVTTNGVTTNGVTTIHFTFEHHVPLLIIAIAIVLVLLVTCNVIANSLHADQLITDNVDDEESRLNINRIWANDMTAFTGAIAAISTLAIALVDELPMDAQLVLAFIAAALTLTSTYYFIKANRSDAKATYLDINKTVAAKRLKNETQK